MIVTLSEEARVACPAWPDNPVRVHWPVDDPASADKPDVLEWKMRKCFLTLENRISALVKARLARTPDEIRLQFRSIGMVV